MLFPMIKMELVHTTWHHQFFERNSYIYLLNAATFELFQQIQDGQAHSKLVKSHQCMMNSEISVGTHFSFSSGSGISFLLGNLLGHYMLMTFDDPSYMYVDHYSKSNGHGLLRKLKVLLDAAETKKIYNNQDKAGMRGKREI